MDSMAQIGVGLSKPFWINRIKNIISKQKLITQNVASRNLQKSVSRLYFGMISIPFRLEKPCPDHQNYQNWPKTSTRWLIIDPDISNKLQNSTERSKIPRSVEFYKPTNLQDLQIHTHISEASTAWWSNRGLVDWVSLGQLISEASQFVIKSSFTSKKRCHANDRTWKCSTIDLQTIFWDDFYTSPT